MLRKWLKRILGSMVISLALYLILGVGLSFIPTTPTPHNCQKDYTIFVASNGIHLDYFIPIVYLENDLLSDIEAPLSAAYISFGWGDKEFYINTPTWSDINLRIVFRALVIRTPAALHVGYHHERSREWVGVALCEHQWHLLKEYIHDEFLLDEHGRYTQYPGYGPEDKFFDAKGHFMLHNTCNVWINNGLKKAEIKTSLWSPFDVGVLYHLRNQEDSIK